MRIRNPPKCRMSISIIMSLIMTLLVFQCNELAAPAEGPRLQKCRLGQPICRGDAAPSRLLAHGKQPTRRSLDPRAPRSLFVRLFFFFVVVVVVFVFFFFFFFCCCCCSLSLPSGAKSTWSCAGVSCFIFALLVFSVVLTTSIVSPSPPRGVPALAAVASGACCFAALTRILAFELPFVGVTASAASALAHASAFAKRCAMFPGSRSRFLFRFGFSMLPPPSSPLEPLTDASTAAPP